MTDIDVDLVEIEVPGLPGPPGVLPLNPTFESITVSGPDGPAGIGVRTDPAGVPCLQVPGIALPDDNGDAAYISFQQVSGTGECLVLDTTEGGVVAIHPPHLKFGLPGDSDSPSWDIIGDGSADQQRLDFYCNSFFEFPVFVIGADDNGTVCNADLTVNGQVTAQNIVSQGTINCPNGYVAAKSFIPMPFTVATLPTGGVATGTFVFASNGRNSGEGAGSGTGCLVIRTNGAWRRFSDNTTVLA